MQYQSIFEAARDAYVHVGQCDSYVVYGDATSNDLNFIPLPSGHSDPNH
jgi:hypothetical protein